MNPAYLKVGGELLQNALLDNVAVRQELNRHWSLAVEFRQTSDERPPVEEVEGQSCQLFSYDQNGAEVILFDGFVFRVQLVYNDYGNYRGTLIAFSHSRKMSGPERVACYTTDSLAAIATEIAGFSGLSASVHTNAKRPVKQYVQ